MPTLSGISYAEAVRVFIELGYRVARDAGLKPEQFKDLL